MHAWYHQKDYLILFKMIPYLSWLCYRGKGSISKYGIRSQLKSCKMKTSGSWRVNKEHVPLCGVMSFVLSWSAHQQAWGCGARRWCRHLGRPPDTEPWSCHWHQWTLMKSKIPVTISMKIHANQAPAASLILWKFMQIKPLSLYLFMSLLWLMWWTFCEIKWFESSF